MAVSGLLRFPPPLLALLALCAPVAARGDDDKPSVTTAPIFLPYYDEESWSLVRGSILSSVRPIDCRRALCSAVLICPLECDRERDHIHHLLPDRDATGLRPVSRVPLRHRRRSRYSRVSGNIHLHLVGHEPPVLTDAETLTLCAQHCDIRMRVKEHYSGDVLGLLEPQGRLHERPSHRAHGDLLDLDLLRLCRGVWHSDHGRCAVDDG